MAALSAPGAARPHLEGDRTIDGDGTREAEWAAWPAFVELQRIDATHLVPARARAVVVAPHPDDEVLAVGGLIAQLAHAGRRLLFVAVTDGAASHPDSRLWSRRRLADERPRESARALAWLGLAQPAVLRLGLPDGGVAAGERRLAGALASVLHAGDVVLTTWRLDGHPDHEATGRACAEAAARRGARLVEVPVWGWHWARPDDPRIPWQRGRRIVLDAQTVLRKRAALREFRSQLGPDPSTGREAILRPSTLARAARPCEIVFA